MVQRPPPIPETEETAEGEPVKRAKVVHRRTLADGKIVVRIVCPVCDHRHWLPASKVGHCPRRCGKFTIEAVR